MRFIDEQLKMLYSLTVCKQICQDSIRYLPIPTFQFPIAAKTDALRVLIRPMTVNAIRYASSTAIVAATTT